MKPATSSALVGKTHLGGITGESVIEYEPIPLIPPNNYPQVDLAGSPEVQVEFTFVAGAGVKTARRRDQLLLCPILPVLCVNPATGAGFFQNTGNFIGGTGRFVVVSGTFITAGTVATLLLNADFTPGFGLTQLKITDTLLLPLESGPQTPKVGATFKPAGSERSPQRCPASKFQPESIKFGWANNSSNALRMARARNSSWNNWNRQSDKSKYC